MLFWAEGGKIKNSVSFANCDVNMLKLFIRFLKEIFHITNDKITIRINCFMKEGQSFDDIKEYWKNSLDIDGAKFGKPTIKISKQVNNYGVCSIIVYSTEIVQKIFGAIQEYGGFNNNLCIENKRSRVDNKTL